MMSEKELQEQQEQEEQHEQGRRRPKKQEHGRPEQKKGKKRKKGGRLFFRIMAVSFVCVILFLTLGSAVLPDREYSEEEKRVLSVFPKLSLGGIKEKDFMEDLESYISDQFMLRDAWIRFKVQCDLLVGKREFNGVYLGKDKYLMQIPEEPDEKNVERNLQAINQFAEKNQEIRIRMMVVPNAVCVMEEYLPGGAPVRDQRKDAQEIQGQLAANVVYIDVTDSLKAHAQEGLYYRTDHHWTSKGARYAFEAAAEELGIANPITDYEIYTVTNGFSGTLSSKSGYHKVKDSIEVYAPKQSETKYLVTDSDNVKERPTIYDRTALDGKDQYQVFFGGNHATVDVRTTNRTNRTLLIFKDSYANCFVPFLLPYYDEIIMVDPRYYYDNVQMLISNKKVTDVLFLYNMDTFLNDRSIADVLSGE